MLLAFALVPAHAFLHCRDDSEQADDHEDCALCHLRSLSYVEAAPPSLVAPEPADSVHHTDEAAPQLDTHVNLCCPRGPPPASEPSIAIR